MCFGSSACSLYFFIFALGSSKNQWREAHLRTKSGGGLQLVEREQGVKGPWVAMGLYNWYM